MSDTQERTSIGEQVAQFLGLGPPDPAVVERKRAEKEAAAKKKKDKAAHKKSLKAHNDKPAYEALLEKAHSAEAEFAALPGTAEPKGKTAAILVKIASDMGDAARLAKLGDYTGALKALKDAKIPDQVAAGKKLLDQAKAQATKIAPDVMKKAAELRQEALDAPLLADAERSALAKRVDAAVLPLQLPGADAAAAKKPAEDLAALAAELRTRTQACNQAKTQAEAALKQVAAFSERTRGILSPEAATEYKRYTEAARTQLAEREYEVAAATLGTLLESVSEAEDELATDQDEWSDREGRLDALLKEAEDLAARKDAPLIHSKAPFAAATPRRLKQLRQQMAEGKLYAGDAVATFDNCEAEVLENRQRAAAYVAFTESRDAAAREVGVAASAVRFALTKLHRTVSALESPELQPDDLDAPFSTELAKLEKDWAGRAATACDAAALDRQGTVTALHGLESRILAACGSDNALEGLLDDRSKRELDAAVAACERKLDALTMLNLEFGEKMATAFETLKATAAAATTPRRVARCLAKVETFAARLDKTVTAASGDTAALQGEIEPKLKAATAALQAFKEEVTKRKKDDDYGGMRDRFAAEMEEQRLLARVSAGEVLAEVTAALDTLTSDISDAASALRGATLSGDDVLTVKEVRKAIAKRKEWASGGDLPTYLQATQAVLLDDLGTIEEEVASKLPEESSELLDAWDARLVEARKAAAAAKIKHDEFACRVAKSEAKLQGKAFKEAKAYRDELAGKLKACLGAGREEGGLDAADKALTTLAAAIDAAALDPAAVTKGDEAAVAAQRKAEEDAAEWKSLLDLFSKRAKEVTRWRSPQRTELEELAKGADRAFKANHDLEAARAQLRVAQRRAEFHAKYPDGLEMATRQSLPAVVADWKGAVTSLKSAMDDLAKTVRALPGSDLPDSGKEAVQRELDLVAALVNPGAFDGPAAAMSGKGRNIKAMRAAREPALRDAQRMLALIEKDPRFMALASNPFSPAVGGAIVVARLQLLKIEKTLLTSL